MKKFFSSLFIIIYAIIAIFVTVCLLSYNDYKVTEFGNYSLIIIDSNEIKGDFEKGALVIVDKDNAPEIGDKAFFYNVLGKNEITLAEVANKQEYKNSETTYTFGEDVLVSESSIIGSTKGAKAIPYAGTVLGILESKWGYLFLIVLISLLAFLYEVSKAIEDIKDAKREEKEEEEKDKKSDIKKEEVKEESKKAAKEDKVEKETEAVEEKIEESQDEELEDNDEEEEEASEETAEEDKSEESAEDEEVTEEVEETDKTEEKKENSKAKPKKK